MKMIYLVVSDWLMVKLSLFEPVIEAMEKGCTLLLDECDLGSNKLMCLQPVLEGKGVYLKKVNKWVTPKDGFNVMATANTKGKGSEDGRFIGTNILNEGLSLRGLQSLSNNHILLVQ